MTFEPPGPTAAQIKDAFEFHRRGRHVEAEKICRAVLAGEPDHFEAAHLLGVALLWREEFDAAEKALRRAVAINPASADAHLNLGAALRSLLRFEEALASFETAIALQADFAEAIYGRG